MTAKIATRVATMTSDLLGRIWMDERAQELTGSPVQTPVVPPEDWSAAFHCYDPHTRMPLPHERLPAYRALKEGEVEMEILIAPPGEPERVAVCCARALHDGEGDVQGVVVTLDDVTDEWLQRVGVETEQTHVITVCPCEQWQLEAPVSAPPVWIEEALLDHLSECVVLTATRMNVLSAVRSLGAVLIACALGLAHLVSGASDIAQGFVA